MNSHNGNNVPVMPMSTLSPLKMERILKETERALMCELLFGDSCVKDDRKRMTSKRIRNTPTEPRIRKQFKKSVLQINNVFSSLGNAYSGMRDTAANVSTTAENMANISARWREAVTPHCESVAARAASILSSLEDILKPLTDSINSIAKGANLLSILMKIFGVLVNGALAKPTHVIESIIVNLVLNFGVDIFMYIKNWIAPEQKEENFNVFDFDKLNGFRFPLSELQIGGMESIREMFTDFFFKLWGHRGLTVPALSAITLFALQFALGTPKSWTLADTIKHLSTSSKNLKSIFDFAGGYHHIFENMFSYILGISLGDITDASKLDKVLSGFYNWGKEIVDIGFVEEPVEIRLEKDKKLAYTIDRLYRQGIQYATLIGEKRLDNRMTLVYHKLFKIIEEYRKKCDFTGVFGNKPRMEPVVIQLFGESGVGKSGMVWPLAIDINSLFCDNLDEAKEFSKNIYFRNVEQEFWDHYAGQNIVVYDDFGQVVDTSAKPNLEFMELIRVKNPAPYPLHMASLEEKKRTKFCSKAVILTQNVLSQHVTSLTFPEAYRRRIDLCAQVRIKDEFTKEGFSAERGVPVKRLDTSKCNSTIDTRPYELVMYNAETMRPVISNGVEKVLSYDEFLQLVIQSVRDHEKRGRDILTCLTERMDAARFESLRKNSELQTSFYGDDGMSELQINLRQFNIFDTASFMYSPKLNYFFYKNFYPPPTEPGGKIVSPHTWEYSTEETRENGAEEEEFFDTENEIGDTTVSTTPQNHLYHHEFGPRMNKEQFLQQFLDSITFAEVLIKKQYEHLNVLRGIFTIFGVVLAGLGIWDLYKIMTHPGVKDVGRRSINYIRRTVRKLKVKIFGYGECNSCEDETIVCDEHPMTFSAVDDEGVQRVWCKVFNDGTWYYVRQDGQSMFSGVEPQTYNDVVGWHFNEKDELMVRDGNGKYVRALDITPSGIHEANSSGDALTRVQKKVVVEAVASGDALTNSPKKVIIEACSSGDALTKKPKVAVVESSLDNEFVRGIHNGEMQMWKDSTAQDLISTRILNNLYKISNVSESKDLLNGLFIRDTVMLLPEHVNLGVKGGQTISIENAFGSRFELPYDVVKKIPVLDSQGRPKDAILWVFPRYVNCHADLVKHFQEMPELARRQVDVALPTLRSYNGKTTLTVLGNANATFDYTTLQTSRGPVVIRDAVKYCLNTKRGDCGAPIICQESSITRKIIGFHIAAHLDGSEAFGQSITRRDLNQALESLQTLEHEVDGLANLEVHSPVHELQFGREYTQEELREQFKIPAPTFQYFGICSKKVFSPSKTDLRPSVIHGFVPPTTKPAHLTHPTENIMDLNLQKCGINTPYISEEEVNMAVKDFEVELMRNSRSNLRRVLTYEESISGKTEDSMFLGPVTRQTSCGYPWVFERPNGKPGKTFWFGDSDEYYYDPRVRERISFLEEELAKGKVIPFVWTDTLKDERRPISKVDQLKTRVFAAGPQDYVLLFRMYFLGFIANCMENRISNEIAVGTNPYGYDWTILSKKLRKFGKAVFAGDFSQFDGTLNSCIMHKFVDVINRWYNDGPRNAMIRRALFISIFNSIHLCNGIFYGCTHSQPSGNPITTILNSFYNSVSMRIAYRRCARKAGLLESQIPPFTEAVSMVSYGDDNVVNFIDSILSWFNQETVTEAYATFGMIYTDEAKTGNIIKSKTLEECSFLKRGFKRDGPVTRAPLELGVVLEMCNWTRGKASDNETATADNISAAVRELALHGEDIFNLWSERLIRAFYEKTNSYPRTKTMKSYLDEMDEA